MNNNKNNTNMKNTNNNNNNKTCTIIKKCNYQPNMNYFNFNEYECCSCNYHQLLFIKQQQRQRKREQQQQQQQQLLTRQFTQGNNNNTTNVKDDENIVAVADVDVITDQSRRNVIARGMKRFEDKGACPPQPDIERLSPRVVTILGQNPTTFTLNGTNCYLIGTGTSRILVDPGETGYGTKEFLNSLQKCITDEKVTTIQLVLLTHMHSDHYGNINHIQRIYGPNIPVAIMPQGIQPVTTMENLRKRGLIPYLEKGPQFSRGMTDDEFEKIARNQMPKWPEPYDEIGPLSWDVMGRTKIQMQRSFFFVKRMEDFQKKLGNEYPLIPLSHGMILRTEGATL